MSHPIKNQERVINLPMPNEADFLLIGSDKLENDSNRVTAVAEKVKELQEVYLPALQSPASQPKTTEKRSFFKRILGLGKSRKVKVQQLEEKAEKLENNAKSFFEQAHQLANLYRS